MGMCIADERRTSRPLQPGVLLFEGRFLYWFVVYLKIKQSQLVTDKNRIRSRGKEISL